MMTFEGLGLDAKLVQATDALGFTTTHTHTGTDDSCIIKRHERLGRAGSNRTGKTAAFGLPLLQLIDAAQKYPQALVVCPTRELCLQIVNEIELLKNLCLECMW